MNRDDVIKALSPHLHGAYESMSDRVGKMADAIMELEKKSKKPEWEKTLDPITATQRAEEERPIPQYKREQIKDFIRAEIIEKICEEIRNELGAPKTSIMCDCIDTVKARWLKGE